ncbi:uncharacterized protein LOC115614533 [Strigops habroptila]|uniref:uncharacterized protein LOC115614533 n=1 Tax=Strigops habroptila TaxID=2489341 RepID=UPI0011CF4262|nr:uncharacterized protein LOC115614533 [Strigops habroptila]
MTAAASPRAGRRTPDGRSGGAPESPGAAARDQEESRQPCDAMAVSQWVACGRGCSRASGADVTVATVTRGGRPTKRNAGRTCVLCLRAEADPDLCGPKLNNQGMRAHHFCLLFADEIHPEGTEQEGQMGFLPEDIRCAVEQAAQMVCFVCGERGATITCQEMGCDRRFHLPCAVEGGCVTRYLLPYSSFCWEHRPQQREQVAPENTTCLICLDPVEGRTTYGTMVCPLCKHAWFHRACIQGQAIRAGVFCFQCPLCRNNKQFLMEMLFMGIRIPIRQASWEDNNTYAQLYQRHRHCNARQCLYPGGREEAEREGPWQLLLCCSCAAEGTHRRCSNLGNSMERWECDSCAGLGTSSGVSSELAGPSTTSPAASGRTLGPPAQETTSPSSSRQMPSGPCHSSPMPEGSSRSSAPGPDRRQNQTCCNHQTQTPYTWRRRQQERSRAVSSTHSQAVLRLSRRSPARETHSRSTSRQQPSASSRGSAALERSRSSRSTGPVRVRDCSRLQRQAQTPYARPRRRRDSSRTSAARAERSPRSQAVPRLSQCSPTRASRRPSTSRQRPSASARGPAARQRGSRSRSTGPVRVRDRSRLQRRGQTPNPRRKRRRESSHTPAPSAKRCTRRQAVSGLSQHSPARATSSSSSDSQESSGSSSGSQESGSSSPSTDSQEEL